MLARRPRLLVLDEPTTGLDPVARHEVLGELMEVLADERRTILFSSHNTLDVEQISDQITFIDRGRIIDSGDKETFLDRWRRLRLEVPPGVVLPALPGIVDIERQRPPRRRHHQPLSTPRLAAAYQHAGRHGAAPSSRMTLEEIFVANVRARRSRKATGQRSHERRR